jgi:hypothetical protein
LNFSIFDIIPKRLPLAIMRSPTEKLLISPPVLNFINLVSIPTS